MAQDFVQHIFEPFTRAENSVTNKVQGTGLGMAITKNIVNLMGGEIRVDSEIGRGSRFEVTVTLPIDKKKEYMIGQDRILLISDEERLVRNVKASMSETSVDFCAVSTEEEAAGWLRQKEADVILLSGCARNKTLKETVNLLRKVARNTTLVFCVDYIMDEEVQNRIAASGVDGIVAKPLDIAMLEKTLRGFVAGGGRLPDGVTDK